MKIDKLHINIDFSETITKNVNRFISKQTHKDTKRLQIERKKSSIVQI